MGLRSEWPGFSHVPEDDDAEGSPESEGGPLSRYVWWDGEIREAEEQSVHYYAHALHYGTAVFESVRCYPTSLGPALFRLRDHLDRLVFSARLYGMKLNFTVEDLVRGAVEVTRQNDVKHAYLRPIAFFGRGPIDLKPKLGCSVHVFIATRELGPFFGEAALRNGVRLTVSSWRKFHHTMFPTMAKGSGQYANSVLASHEALDRGFDDAIMLDHEGNVACATGENLFFVKDGVVHTNDVTSSIVPGITRDTIFRLARDLGIPVTIRAFTREELMRADEVFLTGTAAEVTPVREIDGLEYRTGKQTFGALLQRAYMRTVSGKNEVVSDWLTLV